MAGAKRKTHRSRVRGNSVLFLLLLPFAALQPSACSSRSVSSAPSIHGLKPVGMQFDLGDATRSEFKVIDALSDGRNRLLVLYDRFDRASGANEGRFFGTSKDGGASFGPEHSTRAVSPGKGTAQYQFSFIDRGLAAVYWIDRNIFYTRSFDEGASWSNPSQINDEVRSSGAAVSFVQPSENEIYCLWEDHRRGFSLIYFSASHDGGLTWAPNRPVEHDFLEGIRLSPH